MDELLPGVPAHVDGILGIRDEIVSILSGHSLFGINNSNNTDKPYYSAENTSHIGIIVNKPGELISVRPEQIEQAFGTSNEDLIKSPSLLVMNSLFCSIFQTIFKGLLVYE
ncbi:MAG: chemotaxis protein CheW [Gammaproteobacteria bacterium]|nr:chemotaxis protein CheW [Gammaproteobacteria bacterium]